MLGRRDFELVVEFIETGKFEPFEYDIDLDDDMEEEEEIQDDSDELQEDGEELKDDEGGIEADIDGSKQEEQLRKTELWFYSEIRILVYISIILCFVLGRYGA